MGTVDDYVHMLCSKCKVSYAHFTERNTLYARITTITGKPDRISDMEAQISELRPQLKSIAGLVVNHVVWRADGQCVVMAIYDSKSSANAAEPQIQGIFAGMADLMAAPPKREAYDNAANMLE